MRGRAKCKHNFQNNKHHAPLTLRASCCSHPRTISPYRYADEHVSELRSAVGCERRGSLFHKFRKCSPSHNSRDRCIPASLLTLQSNTLNSTRKHLVSHSAAASPARPNARGHFGEPAKNGKVQKPVGPDDLIRGSVYSLARVRGVFSVSPPAIQVSLLMPHRLSRV